MALQLYDRNNSLHRPVTLNQIEFEDAIEQSRVDAGMSTMSVSAAAGQSPPII